MIKNLSPGWIISNALSVVFCTFIRLVQIPFAGGTRRSAFLLVEGKMHLRGVHFDQRQLVNP